MNVLTRHRTGNNIFIMLCRCFIFVFFAAVKGYVTETLSGTILATDNQSYVQHLGGTTNGNYSTVTWTYSVRSYLYNETQKNPILFFRHPAEEARYKTYLGCFGDDIDSNYGLDPRIITLTPFDKTPGLDQICEADHTGCVHCRGSLKIAIGFESPFFVSVGFRCGNESVLDVDFNFTITAIPDGEVHCTDWSDALSELQEPIYPGLEYWIKGCSAFYPQFSRWNMLGLSQSGYLYVFLIQAKLLQSDCYQHVMETACRILVPECVNSSIINPCRDACDDFNNGCSTYFTNDHYQHEMPRKHSVSFNLTCLSFARKYDTEARPCLYKEVTCTKKPMVPEHVTIDSQNGSVATSVADVSCRGIYQFSSGSSGLRCHYDGEWHWISEHTCQIQLVYLLLIALSSCSFVVLLLAMVTFKFRFELKLLSYKYLSCLLCCFCCCLAKENSNKAYHAFIAYNSEQQRFVKTNIYEPLINSGYIVCVDFVNFLPNSRLPSVIPEAISKSYKVIIILNQQFLDSEWGKYELDQALMQSLEDASLSFLIILMQDKSTLRNVPRWLKGYLRTHIYIEVSDPFFRGKIIQGMPSKAVNYRPENDCIDVECEQYDSPHSDSPENHQNCV